MASPSTTSDMAQFFDFGEATVPDVSEQAAGNIPAVSTKRACCPAHGNGCLCHGFQDDVVLSEAGATNEVVANEPEWNPDFSSWIPRYHKPAQPCDYCRSLSLECFVVNNSRGEVASGCSPCNALFRPCSFSEPEHMPMQKSRTALDTLDMVAENEERCFGGLTGRKQMRSLGHMGPIIDEDKEGKGPKKGAAAARFPRASIKILKDWMIMHIDHPYPTDEEKEDLKLQTGLSISQISNWMANTRRRQKARPKRSASPSIRPSTEPMNIPVGRTWDDLNPFERWKHSPPENEPAPMTAIAKAVQQFDLPEPNSLSSSYKKGHSNDSTGSFSAFRAPSTTSLETGFTQISSGSHNSAWSHGSRNSFGSLNSLKSKERRRRRRLPTRTPRIDLDAAPRLFQCTFCCDRFKNKYDWSRHEKTLHLSLEKWICAPLGDVITIASTGERKCVYCDAINPSEEHLETHHYRACEEKGLEARTFYRKDHLRQHLRLMHGCKMTPSMETWKAEVQVINSRCGFCAMTFTKWQDRVDHLAKEFRNGATMKDWRGCRGLDPHVAAHVVNAMPPYLIANESKSPFPFSASNSSSMKHHNLTLDQNDLEFLLPQDGCPGPTPSSEGIFVPYSRDGSSPTSVQKSASASVSPQPHPNATCWEILTLRLGRFARQYIEKHGAKTVTNKMLQQEARQILYESDDPWNQTAADNPEWLNLFKKAHGIDNTETRAWKHQDILEDLGIRSDAALDRSFNLDHFDQSIANDLANFQPPNHQDAEALIYECHLAGTVNMSRAAHNMSGNNTPFTAPPSISRSTSLSTPAALPTDFVPIGEYDCTKPTGGICLGENGELTFATTEGECAQFDLNPTTTGSMLPPQDPITTSSSLDPFGLTSWNENLGMSMPHTTAGLSVSLPASSGINMDMNMGGKSSVGFGETFQAWDDHELNFDMDMDLSMDMGFEGTTDMDLTGVDLDAFLGSMGSSGVQQQ